MECLAKACLGWLVGTEFFLKPSQAGFPYLAFAQPSRHQVRGMGYCPGPGKIRQETQACPQTLHLCHRPVLFTAVPPLWWPSASHPTIAQNIRIDEGMITRLTQGFSHLFLTWLPCKELTYVHEPLTVAVEPSGEQARTVVSVPLG